MRRAADDHQGGSCMLVMRTGIPMNPSKKTDHIMSRYRPIAPKPTPKSTSGDQTDSHSLSSLSVDNNNNHSNNKTSKSGKRRNNNNSSSNNNKRPPDNNAMKKSRAMSSGSGKSGGGAEGNVEFQPPSFNLTPIFSEQVAPVFGPGGLQRFKDSFDHGVSVSLSLSAKSPPRSEVPPLIINTLQCSKDGLSFNISGSPSKDGLSFNISGSPSKDGLSFNITGSPPSSPPDMGFMERAAINSTSLMEHHSNFKTTRAAPSFFGGYSSFSTTNSEVCSAEEFPPESKNANIVTLSLLPDTPSYVNTRSTTSSTSTLSLLRSDIRWNSKPATTSSDLNTSLTMSSIVEDTSLVAGRYQPDGGMVVVDAHDLEQRHGGSSEAVMLTDERDAVLWVNSAFQRLSNERMSSRMQAIGPHIDPLGIRTRLAMLTFQPPFPAAKCKAILWGFLKKFIMHEGNTHISSEGQQEVAKVIAPQPLRAVGSTITVQTIDALNPNTSPLTESYESVQESLNKGDMPSVITDLKFRVRWVNTAYKRLVGQPKCSWLATTVGDEESPLRLAGDVSLVCEEMQLPDGIAKFTCRVGIQWSHQGEHSAMSVPSEVARLEDGSYVWRFDVCDAGVKNVLQIETAIPFC